MAKDAGSGLRRPARQTCLVIETTGLEDVDVARPRTTLVEAEHKLEGSVDALDISPRKYAQRLAETLDVDGRELLAQHERS